MEKQHKISEEGIRLIQQLHEFNIEDHIYDDEIKSGFKKPKDSLSSKAWKSYNENQDIDSSDEVPYTIGFTKGYLMAKRELDIAFLKPKCQHKRTEQIFDLLNLKCLDCGSII